ncbi:MAG: CDP-diacylglycerol--serine O-phosphatidyltransferase [Flavobacteriales bacterium]|nr:CDP-diacylglycerol--serine O-phosphatidyltransferase [Flavobacteriales bacterium]
MRLFSIPNILTLLNLLSGSIACILTIQGENAHVLLYFLIGSLILDFLDGFVARLTKQYSDIGKELDSLADVISFGLFPGLLIFRLLGGIISLDSLLPIIGLLVPLFSALRLAKFNIDTEQALYFKGLNTPTNAILIFSLFYLYEQQQVQWIQNIYFLIVLVILSCILLISNIPMLSLKFKGTSWKENQIIYLFLIFCLILLTLLQIYAVPILVVAYILISIVFKSKIVR